MALRGRNRIKKCEDEFWQRGAQHGRIKRVPLDTLGIGFVGAKICLDLQKYQKLPQIRDIAKNSTSTDPEPGRGGAV